MAIGRRLGRASAPCAASQVAGARPIADACAASAAKPADFHVHAALRHSIRTGACPTPNVCPAASALYPVRAAYASPSAMPHNRPRCMRARPPHKPGSRARAVRCPSNAHTHACNQRMPRRFSLISRSRRIALLRLQCRMTDRDVCALARRLSPFPAPVPRAAPQMRIRMYDNQRMPRRFSLISRSRRIRFSVCNDA